MLIAIDTCGATGSIALGRWDGETVTCLALAELSGKTFSAQLVPGIRRLLSGQSVSTQDLAGIIVIHGPGSFTGVRIGVAAAKGLAEGLRIPVIALSRLALLARQAGTYAAAIDAGRGEFYFGHYSGAQAIEILVSAAQLRQHAKEPVAICEPHIGHDWGHEGPGLRLVASPDAADALSAAANRLRARDYDDIMALDGNYVRRSDAELFARPAAARP